MAVVNTNLAPLLKEGSNVTLTQDGQVITIASTGGGGGTPGGVDTQIQFNDGGAFGGDAGLTYDKTNNIVDLESIDFATTPTAGTATYRLNVDDGEGSINLGLKGGNVNIALGADVIILSHNAEATTLNKGEVVYLYGASGQRPSVKRADNTSDATSAATFGMVAESIASGAEGFIVQLGIVKNLNTNSYNEGDILYLGTSGGVTTTKQYAPIHNVFVGVVLKKSISAGRIFVKPQNGYELDEIHNVSAQSPSNNDIIAYNTTTSLWEKKQLSAISGITGTGTTNYLPKFTGTSTIGNSLVYDNGTSVGIGTTSPSGGFHTYINSNTELIFQNSSQNNLYVKGINSSLVLDASASSYPGVFIKVGGALCSNFSGTTTTTNIVSYNLSPIIFQSTSVEIARFSTAKNFLINTATDSGFKLDVNGLVNFTGTTASDGGQLGSELLSAAGWTSTDWTGSFGAGWTHTVGNTTALTNTLAAVNGTYYQITYTVTGRTAGSFTLAFGGYSGAGITATGNVGPMATSTATLSITPTSDFDGTIVLSIKVISQGSATLTIKNSSGTVINEISGSSSNTNTFIGLTAGRFNLGINNTFIGHGSGVANTTGTNNSFFGRNSGNKNTIGRANNFLGSSSGYNNTEGIYNSFLGYLSGFFNTTGNYNNFFGAESGYNNTSGNNNSFFGTSCGNKNTTGGNNTFFGFASGYSNTTGSNNSSLGYYSNFSNTTGSNNSFFGYLSGHNNTTGSNNSSLGWQSGISNTTGSNNSFFGRDAGRLISSGTSLTVVSNSVFLGYDTRANADSETNQTVIGYAAIGLGSNTTVIGNSSTTYGRWWGNLLVGTSTNAGYALDVNGTSRFQNDITISDTRNIIINTTTGTKIGTATTQKIGFFNATPVVQPSAVTTSQGIADALSSLGLLASSSITTTPDVGGKLYLFNSY